MSRTAKRATIQRFSLHTIQTALNADGLALIVELLTNGGNADTIKKITSNTEVVTMQTANVQSIGRNVKNFAVRSPWGNIALAGGPYRDKPVEPNYFGVKVAAEINMPYSVKIDIEDFDTPDNDGEVELAILSALAAARMGAIPYVGCMGGMGRTGTVLAIMVKALLRASRSRWLGFPVGRVPDAVDYVRTHYNAHACETQAQRLYVKRFDTSWLEDMISSM